MSDKVYSLCGEVFNTDLEDIEFGSHYYSGDKLEIEPKSLVSDWVVDGIIERMEESLFEKVGEIAEDNLSIEPHKMQELKEYIDNFMQSNVTITCYAVENIEEHTMTEE